MLGIAKILGGGFFWFVFFGSKENEHSFFFMLRDQGELSIFPLAPLKIPLPPSNECSFAARLFYHTFKEYQTAVFSVGGWNTFFLLPNGIPKYFRCYFCNSLPFSKDECLGLQKFRAVVSFGSFSLTPKKMNIPLFTCVQIFSLGN